jgi:hypothetical protein
MCFNEVPNMTKLFTTSALVAATLIASSATANTVLLDYEGQDVKVTNDSQGYDFFNLGHFGPRVEMVTVQLNDGRDEEIRPRLPIGPFRPDGRDEFRIVTEEARMGDGEMSPGFGHIVMQEHSFSPFMPTVNAIAVDDEMFPQVVYPYGNIIQRGSFAFDEDGQLATFGAGGDDGFMVDGRFNYESHVAELYGPKARPELLTEDNDTAIIGFRIDVLFDDFAPMYQMEGQGMYCDVVQIQLIDGPSNDLPIYEECGPRLEHIASYFGFLEVTRGSVTPGILGVSLLSGTGAVVPSVPLPAPALLLGAGLAGLAGMRRRRKS